MLPRVLRLRAAPGWPIAQHHQASTWRTCPSIADGDQRPAQGPLVGYKVLDLGQVVAGNFCGAVLSQFGADVIKVEPPGRGDALRSLRMLDAGGTSLWWRTYGRNRRCITVDLHQPAGRDVIRRLSEDADVLVENFRPGVMEKWQLGPADLKPDLVYTRISGYGQTGPRAQEAGYASVCEAHGGFRHLNGYPDRPPVRPNISLGDTLAGLHAAFGTVMALLHKQRQAGTGAAAAGQVVDASISESIFNMLEGCVTEAAYAPGTDRPPSGSTISDVVPSGTFRTRDGRYVVIGGNGDSVYSRLMEAVGRPDMGTSNPKYTNNSMRCANEAEILAEIVAFTGCHSLEEVVSAMKAARVPCGPILSPAALMREEQYMARRMFEPASPPPAPSHATATQPGQQQQAPQQQQQPPRESFMLPAILPVLSKTPGATRWAGPELGQHTEEVLREAGFSGDEVAALRAQAAI